MAIWLSDVTPNNGSVNLTNNNIKERERKRGKGKGGKEKPNISVAAENSAFFLKKYLFSLYFSFTEQESPFFFIVINQFDNDMMDT